MVAPFFLFMAQDRDIKGIRFYDCDICGFTYRITDTHLNSAGLRVCYEHCSDKGEFRFRPPNPYDINSPVYYDTDADKYYQLRVNSGALYDIEIPHLGGWIPPQHIIYNYNMDLAYTLFFSNGMVYLREGVSEFGKKTPLLVDAVAGVKKMLFVSTSGLTSGVSLAMVEVP